MFVCRLILFGRRQADLKMIKFGFFYSSDISTVRLGKEFVLIDYINPP